MKNLSPTPPEALRLGVNIDHVATLRQARGVTYPSVLEAARVCAAVGADGITVHLREDRRHIQDADVHALIAERPLPINLEMAHVPDIVALALKLKPEEVCLVPEKRQEVTTEGGLDAYGQREALRPAIQAMADEGIRVSLFIDPDPRQLEAAIELGAPCVELHTGAYCEAQGAEAECCLEALVTAARAGHEMGLQINAGHGLTTDNLPGLLAVPYMDTLNIGHSIIARAVFVGLAQAIQEMQQAMTCYGGGCSI